MDDAKTDRHCLNCQSHVKPNKKFCWKCGLQVYKCPNCYAVVEKDDDFCSDCGGKLNVDVQDSCNKAETSNAHDISGHGDTSPVDLASGDDVTAGQASAASESQANQSTNEKIMQCSQDNQETANEERESLETIDNQEKVENNEPPQDIQKSSASDKNIQNRKESQDADVVEISSESSSNNELENPLTPERSQVADRADVQEENQGEKSPQKHSLMNDLPVYDTSASDSLDVLSQDNDSDTIQPKRPRTKSPINETDIEIDIVGKSDELLETSPKSNRKAEKPVEESDSRCKRLKLDEDALLKVKYNGANDLSKDDKSPLTSHQDEKGDLNKNQIPDRNEHSSTIRLPKDNENPNGFEQKDQEECAQEDTNESTSTGQRESVNELNNGNSNDKVQSTGMFGLEERITRSKSKKMQEGAEFGAAMDCESTETTQKDTENTKQNKEAQNDKNSPKQSNKNERRYNKKEKEPDVLFERKNQGRKHELNEKQRILSEQYFEADFRVCISRGFKFDSDIHKVIMRTNQEQFGGWMSNDIVLDCVKIRDHHFVEMKITLRLCKGWFLNGKSFEYKYLMKEKENADKKVKWEHTAGRNRMFKFTERQLSGLDSWHQYDGILHKEPKGYARKTWNKIINRKDEPSPQSEEKEAVLRLLPSLKITEEAQAACVYKDIVHIFSCLEKHWKYSSEVKENAKDFKQEILLEYIVEYLRSTTSSNIDSNENEKEAEQRLAGGMVIVLICADNDLPCASTEITVPLFNALCIRPVEPGKESFEYNRLMTHHFPNSKQRLAEVLYKLINGLCSHATRDVRPDIQFLKAFPLLHFLLGRSTPGIPVETNTQHRNDKWWGIDRVKNAIREIKRAIKDDKKKVAEYVVKLQPLFTTDYLLQRSIMAVANWNQLDDVFSTKVVDLGVALACMSYHIRQAKYSQDIEMMSILIPHLLHRNEMEEKSLLIDINLGKSVMKRQIDIQIYMDFLNAVLNNVKSYHKLISPVVQLIANTLMTWEAVIAKYEANHESETHMALGEELRETWEVLSRRLVKWLHTALPKNPLEYQSYQYTAIDNWISWHQPIYYEIQFVDDNELQLLSEIMNVSVGGESRTNWWTNVFVELLAARIKTHQVMDQVAIFCSISPHVYHHKIEECFANIALDVVESGHQGGLSECDFIFRYIHGARLAPFAQLLAKLMTKQWPQSHSQFDVVKMALEWNAFKQYLKIYGEGKTEFFNESCTHHILEGIHFIAMTVEQLQSGHIQCDLLSLISRNIDGFEILYSLTRSQEQLPLRLIVDVRSKELATFIKYRTNVTSFIQMCSEIKKDGSTKVAIDDLKNALELDHNHLQLNSICKVCPIKDIHREDLVAHPRITLFGLSPEVMEMCAVLNDLKNSTLFYQFWMAHGTKALSGKSFLSISDVVERVLHPTLERLKSLAERLLQGVVTLEEVDSHFSQFRNKLGDLRREICLICPETNTECLDKRVMQVEQYFNLDIYKQGANILMEIKDDFDLEGDFSALNILSDVGNDKSQPLSSMTDEVLDAGSAVKMITEKEANCIKSFHKATNLVTWLQESVKGTKEIKTLVDLAMISAQYQGAWVVERVLMLDAAATAYAPLIYDIKPEDGFEQLLAHCKRVWQALKTDPNLPQKLFDMNKSRNIQWLKNLHESHGSVEVNSMTQAANINANGKYMVGNLEDRCQVESAQQKKHTIIASVLDEKEGENKRLSYDSLCDLQSKLMLVAGEAEQNMSLNCGDKDIQGTKEIERFVEMLDGVTRLATVYTKLNNAGCMLFKHWNATFDCNPTKEMHTEIDFGNKKERTLIKGYKTSTYEVGDEIKRVCEFMEACLEDWTNMISIKRQEFYFLNHFTTEQLVILCTETARVFNQTGKFSQKLGFLLEKVKPNCTEEDLESAIVASLKELDEGQNEELEEDLSDIIQDQEGLEFIEFLKEAGYSQKLAEAALNAVDDPSDKDMGLLWCLENEDSIPPHEDSFSKASDIEIPESHFDSIRGETFEEMTQSLIYDTESDMSSALKGRLTDIWLTYMKASSSTNVSDAFSIELLGHILQKLFENADLDIPERILPPSCRKGQANLIVCPENQMLQLCLSVYLDGPGRKCSMPNVAEILVCTPDTQAEEVELLFRRAFGVLGQGKLYCLLGADRLSYDAGMNLERFYDNAWKEIDFQLLIICAKEREDRSAIVTAFDRFRRENPVLQEPQKLQKCIQEKLFIDLNEPNPALARVDPDWSCVRVIQSHRSGVGKSLKALRLAQKAYPDLEDDELRQECVRIKLHRKLIEESFVVEELFKKTILLDLGQPRLFHIDIAHEVENGVDDFLFKLIILGSLTHKDGTVWQRSANDLYIIEAQPITIIHAGGQDQVFRLSQKEINFAHPVFSYLPTLTCWSPSESRDILRLTNGNLDAPVTYRGFHKNDQLFDYSVFETEEWQRVYQYLKNFESNASLEFKPEIIGNQLECLEVLLRHCGLVDPSWAELRHFVWFLNIQLQDCDESVFCGPVLAQDLPDFKLFVVKSMIQMSRDFATRSLTVSEEGYQSYTPRGEEFTEDLAQFQLKRHWESSPHPYVFFNADRISMSFLGFNIGLNGEMIDHQTGQILEQNMISRALKDALMRNYVPLNEDYDKLNRYEKIDKLHRIMGFQEGMATYPDESYVLTTDNVKKIMAIYMRFRCGIPVIIMGETGCGKTRLIKFMCDLQKPSERQDLKNMVLMKVHGGTTSKDIENKLDLAIKLAKKNRMVANHLDTVMFFDEANTTEDIGKIKRIMVDNDNIIHEHGLKIVAACNPYRRHSHEMVRKLEQAGLGYHVQAEETTDKLGKIPMRRLVYRVQPLPQSMMPLVWDFGQLDRNTELQYIQEMVNKCIYDTSTTSAWLPRDASLQEIISTILAESQNFMRQQKDECSFVSLRDVERTLRVMSWFYQHRGILFPAMNKLASTGQMLYKHILPSDDEKDEENEMNQLPDDVTRALVLAIGVCYHACLDEMRWDFREHIAPFFAAPLCNVTSDIINEEITRCQEVFLSEVNLDANIAKNQALRENVFMMIVCIELRIPLFIVGKPGSSKSLAKTIVSDAMQGDSSRSDLFRHFKSVRMVSYQCSPLATPQGIVETFKQCADLQKDKDLDKIVSVVVLDEVGLAEDSPRMPLKALHPLLEDGCEEDDISEPYMKVAFIGISNWALDPAKMNRGILLQRGVPDVAELTESGKGICATDKQVKQRIMLYIEPMAKAYLKLFENALEIREFFGLRDFYGIIKMMYGFSKRSGKPPTWFELKHCILRNFGGLDNAEPLAVFEKELSTLFSNQDIEAGDPGCSKTELIKACLFGDGLEGIESESRYLLILTENYAALKILQQELLRLKNAHYIFGSSFPKDQEYTQVCRNINKIKICMETGQTVVLMNLESLYESLYDALNQYYVYLGGQRFVDLGLGTHRLKCKVHENFRLIVVAEKQVVYKTFPIPLINRLEKHTLTMETILSEEQRRLVDELTIWAESFLSDSAEHLRFCRKKNRLQLGDVFIGFEKDTAASIVLQVSSQMSGSLDEHSIEIIDKCKRILLQCATPESIERLSKSRLHAEEEEISEIYWGEQKHSDIEEFLEHFVVKNESNDTFSQITTHSKLLSVAEVRDIGQALKLSHTSIQLESLQAFDTEQQFCRQIKSFFGHRESSLLVLQCDSGKENTTLNASARYNILEAYRNEQNGHQNKVTLHKHVVIIVQLPRESGGCFTGYEGGQWLSYHIDELLPDKNRVRDMHALRGQSVSSLLRSTQHESKTELKESDTVLDTEEGHFDSEPTQETEEPTFEDTVEEMDIQRGFEEEAKADDENLVRKSLKAVQNETSDQGVDIEELVRTSAHDAASMLEDDVRNLDRKTERVRLLTELLKKGSSEDGITLIAAFIARLHTLIAEKERELSGDIAQDWLQNEAASQDSIIKAGTYRRSVWQSLQMRIKPCLAGIISLSDSNNNLNILHHAQEGSWIQKMWLAFLLSPVATRLTYNDLTTVLQSREVNKIRVLNYGYQGAFFVNQCPFSWTIKQKLDLIISQVYQNHEDENPKQIVTRLFNECAEGKIIKTSAGGPEYQAYCKSYRHDFLKMCHQFQSSDVEAEFAILEDAIVRLYSYQCSESADTVLLPETELHILYLSIKSRLDLFADAVRVFPDIAATIAKSNNGSNVFASSDDFSLDVQALQILVENLNVTKEVTMSEENRNAWLQKVEKYTPVIEKAFNVIIHPSAESYSYSDICLSAAKTCRSNWNAICAVQLYILHVCKPSLPQEQSFTVDICHTLNLLLGDNVDFKEKNAFGKLEKFLTIGNNKAFKHYFGDLIKCPHCTENAEKLVRMPCEEKHEVCTRCFDERRQMGLRECPVCREIYEDELQVEPTERLPMEKLKGYSNYKERCNSFFMEIVTRLCFAGDKPPSDSMVHKLLSYVTKPGKDHENETILLSRPLEVQIDTIDPTPTVRSLLLQLLLRSNLEDVKSHLKTFFEQGQKILGGDEEHSVQLCLLFVHCIEDSLFGQYAQYSSLSGGLRFAIRQLRSGSNLNTEHDIVTKLENIAQTRFALTTTAEILHKVYCTNESIDCFQDFKDLLESASAVCDSTRVHWVRLFLLRLINRRFGFAGLTMLTQKEYLKWILPEQIRNRSEEDEIPSDSYIVYGDEYVAMKTACSLALAREDFSKIMDNFVRIDISKRDVVFLLALDREIRLFNLEHRLDVLPASLKTNLEALLNDEDFITQIPTLSTIVEQQVNFVNAAMYSGLDSMICELLTHLDVVLNITPIGQSLQPLRLLAVAPARMVGAYLPTMPDDFFSEFQKVAEHVRRANASENMTMYSCPNGHMYAIGDCGRPYHMYTCKECGASIGGKSHVAAEGNVKVEKDNTATGHILGKAQTRPDIGIPERDLTPACAALLRMLTHLSMLLGASRHIDDVIRLISVNIEENGVLEFIMDHIKKDVKVLSTLLNKSPEDCVLSIHIFLANMVQTASDFGVSPTTLKTQRERALWESQVACLIENQCLNTSRDYIDQINERMIQDCKQDANALVRILYPKHEMTESLCLENLDQSSLMWGLRAQITADNFVQLLVENMTQKDRERCQLLNQFLSKEHLLRALRFLPDIIKLQKMLIRRYSNRIDSTEAHALKIQEFLNSLQEGQQQKCARLLQHYGKAWTMLKDEIAAFAKKGLALPIEYQQINMNDIENQPLALLLPSRRGVGVCALALVYGMVGIQNDFLEFYGSLTGKSVAKGLPVGECNVVNLISYHPEQTLLPMLLASRNYTICHGITSQDCTYDFYALQRQIEDRLIKGRTRIETEINGESVVETIVFREDSTNAKVFRLLKNRIPQTKLEPTLAQQISSEYRHVTDINQSLAIVNVTISYLVSVDRDPQMILQKFITEHLALKTELHSQHARRGVRLCHVRSLWLLLSHLKAMELNKLGHDAFDNVDSVYKEELTTEQVTDLHRALQQSTIKAFMDALYECIVLYITEKSEDDDEQIKNFDYPLGQSLHEYMESQGCKPLALLTHAQFPAHLCFRHAIASWKEAHSFLLSGK